MFPDTYAALPTARLLDAYRLGPERLERAVAGLGDLELHAAILEGKWTIHEIVVHVADSEIMGAARVRQTLTRSDRAFAAYDQDVWARELDYRSLGREAFETALDLFRALRRGTALLLDAVAADDWRKSGLHAELGEVTLRQLLELYADHGERHIAQILDRRRRLGTELSLPPLLEERLY